MTLAVKFPASGRLFQLRRRNFSTPFQHSHLSVIQSDSLRAFNECFPGSSFGRGANSFPDRVPSFEHLVSSFNKPPILSETNFFNVGIPRVNLSTPWSSCSTSAPLLGGLQFQETTSERKGSLFCCGFRDSIACFIITAIWKKRHFSTVEVTVPAFKSRYQLTDEVSLWVSFEIRTYPIF